jgi:IS5 family transposase
VVDQQGIPLSATITPANTHDSIAMTPTIDMIPPIAGKVGHPRFRPDKVHADKGYDYPRCRSDLVTRGITPRIARRGIESSEKLGRHRWVVERTFAWLKNFRRLRIRFERRADVHYALLALGCFLICMNHL